MLNNVYIFTVKNSGEIHIKLFVKVLLILLLIYDIEFQTHSHI